MAYIYYYIWLGLAMMHHRVSKTLYAVNKIIFKLRKTSISDQDKWKKDYNEGFVGFPGGILDWWAYGLLLLLLFFIFFMLSIFFKWETTIFKSDTTLIIFLVSLAVIVYYWIYFKSMPWLKKKIRKVNKKYYL